MALKIRLARGGTKKRPHYRIVVADVRSPRDGRFVEKVGFYNPLTPKDDPRRVVLRESRVRYWYERGARPTDRVARFLDAAGIAARKPRNNPQKGRPHAKTLERIAAREKAAAEAAGATAQAAAEASEAGTAEAAPETAAPEQAAPEAAAPETSAASDSGDDPASAAEA